MHPMLNVAIQAIRKSGNFIIKQYELLDRNHTKLSSKHIENFILKIHTESNRIIATIIKKFYPFHIINTHETPFILNKQHDNNIHWIIESIDNDANFIKQFPFFALSIAVHFQKHTEIGVIYDPIHNELFSACRGKGAQFNGYRIRLNNHNLSKNLTKIILAISYTYSKYNIAIKILNKLHEQHMIVDFRQTGSAILDLVYVAIGRVDGCLIIRPQKTNKFSSGILIVQESGGFVTDFNDTNSHNSQFYKNIIAGNFKITKTVVSLIKTFDIIE